MRILILLLASFSALAQLPSSGSLSLKSAAGAGRSISQQVDGNETGDKSLTTLSNTVGFTAPHSILEFYGYPSGPPLPGTMTGCTAVLSSNANGGIELSWSWPASGGSPDYAEIKVSENGGSYTTVTTVSYPTSSYSYRTGLVSGNTYQYTITPVNATGSGTGCGPTTLITFPSVPNAIVSASLSNQYPNGLDASWTYSGSGDSPKGVNVKLYKSGVYVVDQGSIYPTSTDTFAHALLVEGGSYTIAVQVFNAAGYNITETTSSAVIYQAVVPGVPQNLIVQKAIPAGSAGIEIGWDPPATGTPVTTYRVDYSEDGGPYTLLTTTSNVTATHPDGSLTTGFTYQYRVRAENSAGNSAYATSSTITY